MNSHRYDSETELQNLRHATIDVRQICNYDRPTKRHRVMAMGYRDSASGPNSQPRFGIALVVVSALLWSTSGLFIKAPAIEAMQPPRLAGPSIAAWRAIFCLVMFAPWVRFRALGPWKPVAALVGSFSLMSISFVSAMTRADAGDAIFLQYTAPLMVLLVERFRAGVPVGRRELGALVAAMGGVGVIVGLGGASGDTTGLVLALVAGIGYAGVILSLRAMAGQHALSGLFIANTVAALIVVVALGKELIVPQGDQWAWIGGLALIQYAVPYALFAIAMRSVAPRDASMLCLIEPIVNPLWVLLLWGQPIAGHTVAGGTLILLGLILRYWPARLRGR